VFIWNIIINRKIGCICGKFINEFNDRKTFLTLGCDKFEIEFLKDNDPMGILTTNDPSTQQEIHGVGIGHNFGGMRKDIMTKLLNREHDSNH